MLNYAFTSGGAERCVQQVVFLFFGRALEPGNFMQNGYLRCKVREEQLYIRVKVP